MLKKLITVAVAMLVLAISGAEESLVGYWPLNDGEGSVIKDLGPNKLAGTIQVPEKTTWSEGRNGKTLEFNGENGKAPFVMIPGLKEIDLTKGMTVTAWIKPSGTQKRKGIYEIISNCRGSFGKGFRLMIHYQRLAFSSGDGAKKMFIATSTFGKNPIIYDAWMHVAATHDGDKTFKVYIDGELAGTSTEKGEGPMEKGLGILAIGSQFGYSPFLGAVSDVKLYRGVLTDAEILKIARESN